MRKKGILVSYIGPQCGVDLSGMAKDAERLTSGPTLFLAQKCTRTLSKDELDYIKEHHKSVAAKLTVHREVDPEAKGRKTASRTSGSAEALNASVLPKPKTKVAPPPPPPPSAGGGKGKPSK